MKKFLIWLIAAAPLIYLAAIWNQLPETVALHFNLRGRADRFGGKNELLAASVILTLVNAGLYLLLTNIYRIDPKKRAVENQPRMRQMALAVTAFMSAVLCIIIYSASHTELKTGSRLIFAGTGLLFCFIGNYLHTIRPNYFAGIRLPWTLENEDNWRKTHLLAGKLFFAGGLLIAATSLLLPLTGCIVIVLAVTFGIVIASFIYSYRLYKQHQSLLK